MAPAANHQVKMESVCELDDTCTTETWPSLRDTQLINRPATLDWNGYGGFGKPSKAAVKRFYDLPPEVHQRLRQATVQLAAEHSIAKKFLQTRKPLSTLNSTSGVQRYEWARYEVDHIDHRMDPENKPSRQLAIRKPKAQALETSSRNRSRLEKPEAILVNDSYLDMIVAQIPRWMISRADLERKEDFRITLSRIALDAVIDRLTEKATLDSEVSIVLQCFGGYRAGFALPDSEMNLVVAAEHIPPSFRDELPLLLTRAFLSRGYGSFLLPSSHDNRSPVLRVCERPSQDLLARIQWEYPDLSKIQDFKAFTTFPVSCHEDSTRQSPIHCNIYFTNTLPMLYKTELLRCYRTCDVRVHELMLVIKRWAKARKINDPYSGTLSSYGYTLMLLHYLMNIATPPVVPNLHQYTKGTRVLEWVDDCEILFWRNTREIAKEVSRKRLTSNQQSTAALLRGFFEYYSGPPRRTEDAPRLKYAPRFNWSDEVVSIRGPNKLYKMVKRWVSVERDPDGTPIMHLFCIEDPIQPEHNVARMVWWTQLELIRNEFWRAHQIVNTAKSVPGTDLEWRTEKGKICEDLFADPPDEPLNALC
ncbi:hypothetical protein FQN57_007353 [Myotisia sp. PD_48]|nr:hypothetical protein FQN57_007353 [Myotisia sp. PD_48]